MCRSDGSFRPAHIGRPRQQKQQPNSGAANRPETGVAEAAQSSVKQFDFIVIGSGIAGLTYAIKTANYGKVAVITKDYANEGCTQYAQGGVCAVLDQTDSVQDHVRDTIVAGAFLNDNK